MNEFNRYHDEFLQLNCYLQGRDCYIMFPDRHFNKILWTRWNYEEDTGHSIATKDMKYLDIPLQIPFPFKKRRY